MKQIYLAMIRCWRRLLIIVLAVLLLGLIRWSAHRAATAVIRDFVEVRKEASNTMTSVVSVVTSNSGQAVLMREAEKTQQLLRWTSEIPDGWKLQHDTANDRWRLIEPNGNANTWTWETRAGAIYYANLVAHRGEIEERARWEDESATSRKK